MQFVNRETYVFTHATIYYVFFTSHRYSEFLKQKVLIFPIYLADKRKSYKWKERAVSLLAKVLEKTGRVFKQ